LFKSNESVALRGAEIIRLLEDWALRLAPLLLRPLFDLEPLNLELGLRSSSSSLNFLFAVFLPLGGDGLASDSLSSESDVGGRVFFIDFFVVVFTKKMRPLTFIDFFAAVFSPLGGDGSASDSLSSESDVGGRVFFIDFFVAVFLPLGGDGSASDSLSSASEFSLSSASESGVGGILRAGLLPRLAMATDFLVVVLLTAPGGGASASDSLSDSNKSISSSSSAASSASASEWEGLFPHLALAFLGGDDSSEETSSSLARLDVRADVRATDVEEEEASFLELCRCEARCGC